MGRFAPSKNHALSLESSPGDQAVGRLPPAGTGTGRPLGLPKSTHPHPQGTPHAVPTTLPQPHAAVRAARLRPVVTALLAAALLASAAADRLGDVVSGKLTKLNLTEATATTKLPGHVGMTTAKSWMHHTPGKTRKSLDMKCGEQVGVCPAGFCCRRDDEMLRNLKQTRRHFSAFCGSGAVDVCGHGRRAQQFCVPFLIPFNPSHQANLGYAR